MMQFLPAVLYSGMSLKFLNNQYKHALNFVIFTVGSVGSDDLRGSITSFSNITNDQERSQ